MMTPEPSVAPIARVPSNVSGVSSSAGETKAPAAPPSSTACRRPLPPTPPARSIICAERRAEGNFVHTRPDYVAGKAKEPVARGFSVPMRAYAAPPRRMISGILISVSTLLTTVGWRNKPACVGKRRLVARLAAIALDAN